MIDFDPISAAAARKAVDEGIYGTPAHARLELDMRLGRPATATAVHAHWCMSNKGCNCNPTPLNTERGEE